MRRPLRLSLALVGLSLAVYAGASLTGGWLGTPPWWEKEALLPMLPIDFNAGQRVPSSALGSGMLTVS
ncbi:MAG TPA: hypothetical protein VGO79_04175, partial [Thermoanaerobaculia bacterium]